MWLMTRLAIIFYISILWFSSIIVILFTLHQIDIEQITEILQMIYRDSHMAWIVGLVAVGLIFVSILLENLIYGQRRLERHIAFDNPAGQVTVSLSALEDVIKRLTDELPVITEIRPVMRVQKGLHVEAKIVLGASVNIPELTSRLQELIRRRIEEVIGMEGKIFVQVHVMKITLDEPRHSKRSGDGSSTQIPFHGYRA